MSAAWKFPLSFSQLSSGPAMIGGDAELTQSVAVLLQTLPGERFLVPGFGFNWRELVFEPANWLSASLFNPDYVRARINDVLDVYENRVELEEVQVTAAPLDGTVTLDLVLRVRASGDLLTLRQQFR